MDIVSCRPDDLAQLKSLVTEAYESANNGAAKLILVPIVDLNVAAEMFDFLDKVFYYYAIPHGFSHRDKMDQGSGQQKKDELSNHKKKSCL